MITDFMLVEGIEEKMYSTRCSDRENGTERSEVISVEGSFAGRFSIPPEIIRKVVAFMAFVDLLSFRHASSAFFRFTAEWEIPIVASFLKSCDMLVADKLFRTLIPNGPATYDYLLRLRRRCTTAGNLANFLINHLIPPSNAASCFEYTWLDATVVGQSSPSIEGESLNADKLKRCLLLHNHFFESLHAGLANYFAVEKQETQPRPEVSAFLQVEAAILGHYTPNAIDRLLGGHPALEDIFKFVRTYRLERLYSRLHQATATSTEAPRPCVQISPQVLPPLELEIARKVSSILPTGYVRNLGVGWAPFVDRENAFAQFADYVLSAVDDDDEMLVQDTSANHLDANASPEVSLCVTSERPPTSTSTIPITRFTRRMRRPNRPCALKGISRD